MKAGKLDRTITLRQPTRGGHNGFTKADTFADAGTRKAELMPQGPREGMETGQRVSSLAQRFRVRSDSLTRQITPTWKLVYSGATYDIIGTTEDGRRHGLIIETAASDRNL